ncbi:hypothetical protein GCK32_015690, partial [Trichostrongylus colubriformis]
MERREKYAQETAQAYSPEYHMFLLLFTSALIALLVWAIFSLEEHPIEEIRETPSTFDMNYEFLVVMTENIDCSIYLKQLYKSKKLIVMTRHAMACISLLVPSSAAGMKSTFSMTVFHRLRSLGLSHYTILYGRSVLGSSLNENLQSDIPFDNFNFGRSSLGSECIFS